MDIEKEFECQKTIDETESIKKQIQQRVLDLKISGKLTSSVGATTLPDLISAFEEAKPEEKENDEKKNKEKESKIDVKIEPKIEVKIENKNDNKIEEERESSSKPAHSKNKESKYHGSYGSRSHYYREGWNYNKEKRSRTEKNPHSGAEDTRNPYKTQRNRSRSRTRSRNKSKSRSYASSRHHGFSKSPRDKRIRKSYSKVWDNNSRNDKARPREKEKERSYRRSKSRKGDRSRSKTSERGRHLSKNNRNERRKRHSKSRSYSNEKKGYYRRKSPSYEKRYNKNDSKEKYRKKYMHNTENNKEKETFEKEDPAKLSRSYKNAYNEPFDKYNPIKLFDKPPLTNSQSNEDNYKRSTSKPPKASILERINKGLQSNIHRDSKENGSKNDENFVRLQRFAMYDDFGYYNEEKSEIANADEGLFRSDKKKTTGNEKESSSEILSGR